jgi:beta-glucosidase
MHTLYRKILKMKIFGRFCVVFVFITYPSFISFSQKEYLYKNPKLSVEERATDLISRMTLEEKVYQLRSQLLFLPDYKKRDFRIGHVRNIGHFLHQNSSESVSARECAIGINEDTRKSIAANRWGIPVLQNGEALHGAQWGNATCFPQSIAMAATFDDSLYFNVGKVVAEELRAVGVRQVFAPVINISRDPRWGRTEETYGEDVYLTSRMGVAYVKALEQGGVIATLKHYVDNYGEGGHDSYASDNSWRTLRETFLEPFRVCVEEGHARSIMASYNSIDGTPCSSNAVLLNNILRNEWKFKGFVVSDYGGVKGVYSVHKVAEDYAEAQAQCFEAGLDVELSNGYPNLLELVKNGRISEKQINESLHRVLTSKFELGLFESPYADAEKANQIVRCNEHKNLALDAARKAMTLLKNTNNLLPLSDKTIKKIGVFGPAANVLSMGDYSGPYGGWKGEGAVNPYQALVKRLEGKAKVILHQPGQDVTELAKTCDVVVFFGAIKEGEGHDRSLLALPSQPMKKAESLDHANIIKGAEDLYINVDQEKMIADLAGSGTKTVVVLQNGSPIDIRNWVDKVDALLEAWYPGEQGGTAIAEVLFGDINPGGHLPVSWPRHAGQLPIYYSIKPSGRGYDYNDDDGKPMFPFGFGLSYTTFEYTGLMLPDRVEKDSTAEVKFNITNTGKIKGDAVVQLYIHDELASLVRPLKELKAFRRVTLEPGESRQIVLRLPYRSFGFWNKEMKFGVESGIYKIYIADDAVNSKLEGNMNVL